MQYIEMCVSVPIRGLFSLTAIGTNSVTESPVGTFPSPSGDYLV